MSIVLLSSAELNKLPSFLLNTLVFAWTGAFRPPVVIIFYLTTCSNLVTERRILIELCPPLRAEVVIR